MTEYEVKILEIDPEEISGKLLAFGAQKTLEGEIRASLWDFPDQRLKQEGKVVRLRTRGSLTELTFKEARVDGSAKGRPKHEIAVSDEETAREILRGLGLQETQTTPPYQRSVYELEGVEFKIDTYSQFPPFLEIESSDEKEVLGWVEKLGFSPDDAKPWAISQVFAHYGK